MISHKFISKSSNRSQLIPIKPPRNYWTLYVYIAIPIKPRGVWLVYWQIDACLTSINISFYGLLQPNIDFLLLPTLVCIEIQRKDADTRCKSTLTATGILPQILAFFCRSFLRPLEPDLGQTRNGNLFVTWCNAMKKQPCFSRYVVWNFWLKNHILYNCSLLMRPMHGFVDLMRLYQSRTKSKKYDIKIKENIFNMKSLGIRFNFQDDHHYWLH